MFNLQQLVRPHILSMKPYSSARDEYSGTFGTFLDANENSLGSATEQDFTRYPDPHQIVLKQKLSEISHLNINQIFIGNGSDEPIDLLIRAFCRPTIDNVILLPPTYGMYKVSAVLNEIEMKIVPLTTDFQLDVGGVLKAIDKNTKIIFICSPNNPTGNLLDKASVVQIINNFEGLVVIDQAYVDFALEGDFTNELNQFPNIVILKTLSKAWGLAALRLGMAFSSAEIIAILNKIKPPYNINVLTQQKALEALDNEVHKNEMVGQLIALRAILVDELSKNELVEKIFPSDTNFLLVKFNQSKEIFDYLIENKVIVRDRSGEINCGHCLRITVGTEQENLRLITLLKTFNA
jgi:histidinol-phosphate aminotransferase